MEASHLGTASVGSALTNSQLPISCSESWSESGHGMSRSGLDRGDTVVKSTGECVDVLSLHSAAEDACDAGSCEPQMPRYVDYSDEGSSDVSIVNLVSDFVDDDHRTTSGSRLSADCCNGMTLTDANPDHDDTSAQPESRAPPSVLAVQCTQKSDNSHSYLQLPACRAFETPVVAVSESTPGCGRDAIVSAVTSQLHVTDVTDNRGAGGGGIAVGDMRTGCCSSTAAPHQYPASSRAPQSHDARLSSATGAPTKSQSQHAQPQDSRQQRQQQHSLDKIGPSSLINRHQPGRPVGRQTSAGVDHSGGSLPASVHINTSAGAVNVYNLPSLTGPVQIGDHNVMHVGAAARHHHVSSSREPSSSSVLPGRQHSRTAAAAAAKKQKKQIRVADRAVDTADLQQVSIDIGNDWRSLGRQLSCSDADLDTLHCDFHVTGQREVAYQMLRGWHEKLGNDARLTVLAKALVDIKRADVALKLQDAACA